jgi:hypothetical protein
MAATVHWDFERFSWTITHNFRVLDPKDFGSLRETVISRFAG